jgi:MFS family permease
LRALAHHNFRLYFAGQAISILGSWIQQVALSWLVYRLTGSVALLGVTTFAAMLPQLLVGPFAGAWADRHDKRRMLILVQALLGIQALLLAVFTALDWMNASLIVAMSVLLGVLNAFDTPLRQSLINSFVGNRADLPNALALNAMLFNSGRFVGPPIAGALVGLTSEAVCFALNAVSFLALMVGVILIRVEVPARANGSMAHLFLEGVRYAWQAYPIRMLILILAVTNITASCYAVLLPVFAKDVFGGDASTLGWLWGAAGCGAFAATVFLAMRKSLPGLVRVLLVGAVLSAFALMAFAYNRSLALALCAMAVLGFGISVSNVAINMLLQSLAPEALRGRIVAFFASTRFGFDAIGGLLAGFLAAAIGVSATLLFEGGVLLLLMVGFWFTRQRLQRDIAAGVS